MNIFIIIYKNGSRFPLGLLFDTSVYILIFSFVNNSICVEETTFPPLFFLTYHWKDALSFQSYDCFTPVSLSCLLESSVVWILSVPQRHTWQKRSPQRGSIVGWWSHYEAEAPGKSLDH